MMNSHTLRDVLPTVVIPQGFFRFPKEWSSMDYPLGENLGTGDLRKAIADYLHPLVPIAQSIFLELILTIFESSAYMMLGTRKVSWVKFANIAKFGDSKNPDLQEEALRLMQKVAGEVYQLSLGDVKAIFFITTLEKQCIPSHFDLKQEHQKCADLRKQLVDNTEGLERIRNCGGEKEAYKALGFRALRVYDNVILVQFEEIEKLF
jgi:hypothetical protein